MASVLDSLYPHPIGYMDVHYITTMLSPFCLGCTVYAHVHVQPLYLLQLTKLHYLKCAHVASEYVLVAGYLI